MRPMKRRRSIIAASPWWSQGKELSTRAGALLPLPACHQGVHARLRRAMERVGVRGLLHKGGLAEREGAFPRSSDSWRGPLTRNLRGERANSDLSIARR